MKIEKIKEGLFFKKDFAELPDNVSIYIKSGKIMIPEDGD